MSTKIQWTDETWNPTVGCSRVSPGCDGCYAIGVAHRAMQPAHEGLTAHTVANTTTTEDLARNDVRVESRIDWTGEVRLLPDRLDTPFRWRKPRRVFVDSMSDLFHPEVDDLFLAEVFAVMSLTPQHTYQILTKRQKHLAILGDVEWRYKVSLARMRLTNRFGSPVQEAHSWPWPNIWVGVSVEDQRYADLRIPHLLATPAAVRFLSVEPLLGPVDLTDYIEPDWIGSSAGGSGAPHPLIDWVIVGGESGPGARPMNPDWARLIRDQCVAAGVPFHFKQWGEWAPLSALDGWTSPGDYPSGLVGIEWDGTLHDPARLGDVAVKRVGKKAAGRELDGRTWDEFPT